MRRKTEAAIHPASFRDPSGFLFRRGGRLYRQVNQVYAGHYQALTDTGLYEELVEARLLLPHTEVDLTPERQEEAFRVLEPEAVSFVSYPYEWCFSQLKDSALGVLEIQRRALQRGMTLKDASAYNMQFHLGRPTAIDTLSFEVRREGEPWVAYRQFCQHYLAPLALMAYRDVRLSQLLRAAIDGIALDLASALLPWRTRLNPGMLVHLHFHAAAQRRFAGETVSARPRRRMGANALLGLVDSLSGAIRRLRWRPTGTAWVDYESFHGYSEGDQAEKGRLVEAFLDRVQPDRVWDLGANIGRFSRLASQRGIPTVAFDVDPGAVERSYLEARSSDEEHLLPLVLDLTNPSPALGWAHQERMSLIERGPAGSVFALALIHHLAITNNVPLPRLAEFLAQLGDWLLIEFVPKDDPQVGRLLASREDIFVGYTKERFEAEFGEYFSIHRQEPVGESGRRLYWMERRS